MATFWLPGASGDILRYDGDSGASLGTLVSAGSGGLESPIRLVAQLYAIPEPSSLTLSLVGLVVAGVARVIHGRGSRLARPC